MKQARRDFLGRLLRVLGGIAGLEAGWIAASVLSASKPDEPSLDGPGVVVAGPIDRFAHGSVTPFQDGFFYLARLEDGGFLAMHRKCTHLGCSVPWVAEEQRFVCPCHASAFNLHGDVVNAPAPRPLDLFPVTIKAGIVTVDTRQPVRRRAFESAQVVYA